MPPQAVPFIIPRARSSRRQPSRGLVATLGGLACLVLVSGSLAKRATIVRAVPRAAGLYALIGLPVNVRGLALGEVATVWLEGGTSGVAISGRIRNLLATRTTVPRLAFDLRDAKGSVLASWSETPPKRALAANETVPFTAAQVPPLPEGTRDVVVRFTDSGHEQPLVQVSRR